MKWDTCVDKHGGRTVVPRVCDCPRLVVAVSEEMKRWANTCNSIAKMFATHVVALAMVKVENPTE